MSATADNESGILVYPRLPVPAGRRNEPGPPPPRERRGRRRVLPIVALVLGAGGGGAGAWFLRPMIAPDPQMAAAATRASDAESAAAAQNSRADALEKSLDEAGKGKREAEAKLAVAETAAAELAGRTAAEAGQRKAAEAALAKLKPALDRASGAVTLEGTDVHVRISDRALFKASDDALTDHGKAVLSRLAAALKDLPDKPVWVQGHTDDTPVPLPRPAPAAPPARGARPAAPPPAPVIRFPTNWELSAGRALAVVRYFQDVARLEPSRLTAQAFSQYAPISKRDRSANRRIELVVTAKPAARESRPSK